MVPSVKVAEVMEPRTWVKPDPGKLYIHVYPGTALIRASARPWKHWATVGRKVWFAIAWCIQQIHWSSIPTVTVALTCALAKARPLPLQLQRESHKCPQSKDTRGKQFQSLLQISRQHVGGHQSWSRLSFTQRRQPLVWTPGQHGAAWLRCNECVFNFEKKTQLVHGGQTVREKNVQYLPVSLDWRSKTLSQIPGQ